MFTCAARIERVRSALERRVNVFVWLWVECMCGAGVFVCCVCAHRSRAIHVEHIYNTRTNSPAQPRTSYVRCMLIVRNVDVNTPKEISVCVETE